MLGFSEDSKGLAKLIDGLDDVGAGLGEFFPIDVGVLSDGFDDALKVLLDGGNVYLAHVEKDNYIKILSMVIYTFLIK